MATEEASEGLVFHPMDQFKVEPLFGGDATVDSMGSLEIIAALPWEGWKLAEVRIWAWIAEHHPLDA